MTSCPTDEDWVSLLAKDHRLEGVRAHAETCATCRSRLVSVAAMHHATSTPLAIDVGRVLRGVDERLEGRRHQGWSLQVGLVLGAAVVGMVSLGVWQSVSAPDDGFVARGTARAWKDRVRVEVRQVDRPAEALVDGQVLDPASPLTLWYRNAEHETPLFVSAWLVDAADETAWIAPAYLEEGVEPSPAMLRATDGEALWSSSVKLASPAPGRARLVVVVTRAPRSVLEVERQRPAERRAPSTEDAVVWTRDVVITRGAP
jgi:hypothetical protein